MRRTRSTRRSAPTAATATRGPSQRRHPGPRSCCGRRRPYRGKRADRRGRSHRVPTLGGRPRSARSGRSWCFRTQSAPHGSVGSGYALHRRRARRRVAGKLHLRARGRGTPGRPARLPSADQLRSHEEEAANLDAPDYTDADVTFVKSMIPYHAQALEMTAMVAERTSRADFPLLAERIEISQQDELALLERWPTDRGDATRILTTPAWS